MRIISANISAKISEIFSSVQGEGVYAGQPQIFIRFYGCNMNCVFCDTPRGEAPGETGLRAAMEAVSDLNGDNSIHAVYLTGGEPLLQCGFIKALLPNLRDQGYAIHIDTNATLPERLKEVIDLIDLVAMDIKLPSSTGERPFWDEHEDFLSTARAKEVFVKAVITRDTQERDFWRAVDLVARADPKIAFILQPAARFGDFSAAPEISEMLKWQNAASSKLRDVRILPQLHKIWGLR